MKLHSRLIALIALACLGAAAQASTFDAKTAPFATKPAQAAKLQVDAKENTGATTQVAVQIDGAKKVPLILAADHDAVQKPQIALSDAKKAWAVSAFAQMTQQHAVVNYIGVDKAVNFKLAAGQVTNAGDANKVSGTTQQFAGTLIPRASAVGRGDGVSPGNVIS